MSATRVITSSCTSWALRVSGEPEAPVEVADWRREVQALYGRMRGEKDPESAHELRRMGRDHLFATHPQSPLIPDDVLRTSGVPYWPYDAALRWTLSLTPPIPHSAIASEPVEKR